MLADPAGMIRSGYAAFNRQDLEAVIELLHSEVSLEEPPELPGGTTYYGRDAVARRLAEMWDVWEQTSYEPEEIVDLGDDRFLVLVRVRNRGQASGIELDAEIAHVWTVKEGLAVRMQQFISREAAREAVGAPG
jgi:ketosteroid isomerase-like protein